MTTAFVYVTDKRGFELTIHSAMSVSLSQPSPVDVHVFCHRFVPEQAPRLKAAMVDVGADLTFHSISDAALEDHKTHGHVTTAALLKLSAVEALTERHDRIVYLDNDILVFEPLNIARMDFGTTPLAAVLDMDLSQTGSLRQSVGSAGNADLRDLGHYFNSGFLVFDSANFRRRNYLALYAAALNDHDRHCSFKIDCTSADQCALNATFDGQWLRLPPGLNMQASAKFTAPWKTAPVRHFCGPRKFLPLSWFRNDSRDVRLLNRIRGRLDLPKTRLPSVYEALFRLNVVRKYRTDLPMRRYLDAVQALNSLVVSSSVRPRTSSRR